FAVVGSRLDEPWAAPEDAEHEPTPDDTRVPGKAKAEGAPGGAGVSAPSGREDGPEREVAVPVAASDEERLRGKRFDALEPGELALLYKLMTRIEVATPTRRTRRAERARRGEHVDLP